ncbi:MAG: oxidoreductase [Hymenobacter sp.]
MRKTALLAGASGLIGSHLLPLLLESERYSKVIVVGRKALPVLHPKLTQVVTELDHLAHVRLQLIADDVFCCLGTTRKQAGSKEAFYRVDYLYVVTLAALAAGNFASQFMVVSSLGADADAQVYYSRVKGEMEAAVRQTPFRAIHIFRPSLLRGPLKKYQPVSAAAVAAAMLRAAEDDGGGVRVHESDELAGPSAR